MKSKYRQYIIYLALLSLSVGLWLDVNELLAAGFCPPYPGLGLPACYVVTLYFLLILGSQFVRRPGTNRLLFHLGAIPGFFTAVWFSVNNFQGKITCPQLLSIPLCYVALITFLVLIILHQVRCIDECAVDQYGQGG